MSGSGSGAAALVMTMMFLPRAVAQTMPNYVRTTPRSSRGCTILSAPLRQLNQWLSNPMGKQKFLNATEEAFRRHPGLCTAGARMLDVGAGGGEYTHWLGTRCSFCVKAYEVHNESSLPYHLSPQSQRPHHMPRGPRVP